jgi:hypothetical protein
MIILIVYLYETLNLSDIPFNQSIICRKVLISMYYVIFRWAAGEIKFWESTVSSITY